MVVLGDGADILGAVVVPGGGCGAWPELAGLAGALARADRLTEAELTFQKIHTYAGHRALKRSTFGWSWRQ
jgi:hypothetical protein